MDESTEEGECIMRVHYNISIDSVRRGLILDQKTWNTSDRESREDKYNIQR